VWKTKWHTAFGELRGQRLDSFGQEQNRGLRLKDPRLFSREHPDDLRPASLNSNSSSAKTMKSTFCTTSTHGQVSGAVAD
jgi:hypothetical protein